MDKRKSAIKPAIKSKDPFYYLTPLLPGNSNIGHLAFQPGGGRYDFLCHIL